MGHQYKLGLMAPQDRDQKFYEDLLAHRHEKISMWQGLWASRWALMQWCLVVSVAGFLAARVGSSAGVAAVAFAALGALSVQLAHMRRAATLWPLTAQVINWQEVESRATLTRIGKEA